MAEAIHYAPGDIQLCGLEDFPAPMTPEPELVRGCRMVIPEGVEE